MPGIQTVLGIIIAVSVVFLFTATLVYPLLKPAYQFCQAKTWRPADAGVTTNCTTNLGTNTTTLTGATHTENGETWPTALVGGQTAFCLDCSTPGGYRTTWTGLIVLILVLGLIGVGLNFLPRFS